MAKRMERNFAAEAHCHRGAWKRLVSDGLFDYGKRRLELRFAAHIHRLQSHRIGRKFHTKAGGEINARNGDREVATNGNFAEEGARNGNLCDIADTEGGEPGFGFREAFDGRGAAKCGGDYGFAGFVKLVNERNLVGGNVDIALAVADTDKQREDRDVVRV